MYAPALSRYARGSAPHRVGPPASAAPRVYDADADADDELLSANELVKTLQPPPPVPGRARSAALGGARGPRPEPVRGAMAAPHDYFQPPARLPRDASSWHALDADTLPYAEAEMDALSGRRGKFAAGGGPQGPSPAPSAPMDAEHARARAFQLMMEHQRQSQLHNQQQLRHYQQQQQHMAFHGDVALHEQQQQLFRHRQHPQHPQHAAMAMAMSAAPRGFLPDDLGRGDSPMAAQTLLRHRGGRTDPSARGGYEHAHRIHRELQPPPSRFYPPDAGDAVPMAAMAGRPAGPRRRVASPASPDFDPHFDLLQFDPPGMDLYDEADMALPASLDAHDELLGRPAGIGAGSTGSSSSARRLERPLSGPQRRGAAPTTAMRGGYPARFERAADADSGLAGRPDRAADAESSAGARHARPPPSGASQGAAKRPKLKTAAAKPAAPKSSGAKVNGAKDAAKAVASASATPDGSALANAAAAAKETTMGAEEGDAPPPEPKRRCGRKSMNYSSEQKRERNRAAVKKCRQRQALKLEYLQHKGEVLQTENKALSEMLLNNTELDEAKRRSLTRGIQMDILLKIKEIFTQSLPKDFVLDADSIWDLNSVLAVSMPSRCYYGIESIKDFWRTSLRMRNKGKIRSFWAWLFRLPPGDRFTEFKIEPFSPTSSLYFISWTTKSDPPLAGSMVIMFGHGHRVTLHVECFGWLIWRYLLTNEPFPEPPME